jgi:hypothetical protein
VSERETEQQRHVFDTLLDRDERWRAEDEQFAAYPHPASASCLDVSVPVRLAPEVQADDHGLTSTERAHGGVAHDAGLAARVLQLGKGGVTGEVQGHGIDRAADVPCEGSRKSHWLPASLGSARVEQYQSQLPGQPTWDAEAMGLFCYGPLAFHTLARAFVAVRRG